MIRAMHSQHLKYTRAFTKYKYATRHIYLSTVGGLKHINLTCMQNPLGWGNLQPNVDVCMKCLSSQDFFSTCVEVISCRPTWPSVQAGCSVWQLEIISFISHFPLVTHISAKTKTCIHTHTDQRQRHQTQVAAHTWNIHVCADIHGHTFSQWSGQIPSHFPCPSDKAYFLHHTCCISIQSQTSNLPILTLFLQACRADDGVLLAGAVHKMCFRRLSCDLEGIESLKCVSLMLKVPVRLILWHTHIYTHSHLFKTQLHTHRVIHTRSHVVFLQGLIFTAVTHGDVQASDGSVTCLHGCCCSLN